MKLFFESPEIAAVVGADEAEIFSLKDADFWFRRIFDKLDKAVHIVPTADDSPDKGWILSVNESKD